MLRRLTLAALVMLSSGGLLVGSAQRQDTTQPAPRGTGVIIGRVVDSTGAPVKNAVLMVNPSGYIRAPSSAVPNMRTLVADDDGEFYLRDLPRSTYQINAHKDGYVDGAFGRRSPDEYNSEGIEIEDGQRRTDITITLWKLATVSGVVTDMHGAPIVNAYVTVQQLAILAGYQILQGVGSRGGQTDDRGAYRISGVQPGQYAILARSNDTVTQSAAGETGRQSFIFAPVMYRGASSTAVPDLVTLTPGQALEEIDFRLPLVAAFRVEGRVQGADAAAYTNIELVADRPSDMPWPDGWATWSASMQPNGSFVFPAVPTGAYLLRAKQEARLEGGVSGRIEGSRDDRGPQNVIQTANGAMSSWVNLSPMRAWTPPPLPTTPPYVGSLPVVVGSQDVRGLVVPMQPGPRLSGRVVFEGATPPTAEETSPGRFVIQINPADGKSWMTRPQTLVTPDGRFTAAGLMPGRYVLREQTNSRFWLKDASGGGQNMFPQAFEVRSDDITDMRLVVADRYSSVSGEVVGLKRRPGARARVIAFPADSRLWTDYGSQSPRLTECPVSSDSYGLTLPPGDYWILATSDLPPLWQDPRSLALLVGRAERVTLREGDNATLPLKAVDVR